MIKIKHTILLLCLCNMLSAQTSYKDEVFTQYFRRSEGWISSDATISVPLPNGKVVWMFGDTHLDNLNPVDTTVPCLFQVRNSMMVQDAVDRNQFITILDNTKKGIDRTPVKLVDSDTTLFWPGHGFVNGDTLVTFWIRYHSTKLINQGIYAVKILWQDFTDASSIKSIEKLPIESSNAEAYEFGNAVIADTSSNYLYVYGHKRNWIVLEPFLARCPLDNLMSTWEYYSGSGWTTNLTEAKKISNHYVSPSFSAFKLNDKYYIVTQENGYLTCGLGRQIFAYSSDSPTGPFENKQTVFVIYDKHKGSFMITYNGTAHPEFSENNELLVSYNVNGICPSECQNAWTDRMNADTYRPKFVRVPFSVLDTGLRFAPQAVIDASQTEGDPPFTVDFTARASLGDGGISYYWDFGDGTNSNGKDPSHIYNTEGIFEVKLIVTDSKQNKDTAIVNIFSGTTNAPTILKSIDDICVYPNPATDSFIVEMPDFHPHIPTVITITDAVGKDVVKEFIESSINSYTLNEKGLYYVMVQKGESKRVKKLIIQ